MKRARLQQKTPLRPGQPLRRSPWRKPTRVLTTDAERSTWQLNPGPCAMGEHYGTRCHHQVRGHHVIPRQALRKARLLAFEWDLRNRLPLCDAHHNRFHSRSQPVPRELLPLSAFEYAAELGLDWLLERLYPEEMAA